MGPSLSQRNRSRKGTPGEICSTKTDHKMFVLAEMKDTVRIKPWHFGVDLREAIATKLNKKLANKVSGGKTIDKTNAKFNPDFMCFVVRLSITLGCVSFYMTLLQSAILFFFLVMDLHILQVNFMFCKNLSILFVNQFVHVSCAYGYFAPTKGQRSKC